MSPERGRDWGAHVPAPDGLRWCEDDAAASVAVGQSVAPALLAIRRSRIGASVGRTGARESARMLATPWDAMRLRLRLGGAVRDVTVLGRAWIVRLAPRGAAWVIATTSPVGRLDLHPRAHPADGWLHVLEISAAMTWRERVAGLGRARRGDHVPHPALRATRATRWSSGEGRAAVVADGHWCGIADHVEAEVRPDACTLHW